MRFVGNATNRGTTFEPLKGMSTLAPDLDFARLGQIAAAELRKGGVRVDGNDAEALGPYYAEAGLGDLRERTPYAKPPHGVHLAPQAAEQAVIEYVKARLTNQAPGRSADYREAVTHFQRRAAAQHHTA